MANLFTYSLAVLSFDFIVFVYDKQTRQKHHPGPIFLSGVPCVESLETNDPVAIVVAVNRSQLSWEVSSFFIDCLSFPISYYLYF